MWHDSGSNQMFYIFYCNICCLILLVMLPQNMRSTWAKEMKELIICNYLLPFHCCWRLIWKLGCFVDRLLASWWCYSHLLCNVLQQTAPIGVAVANFLWRTPLANSWETSFNSVFCHLTFLITQDNRHKIHLLKLKFAVFSKKSLILFWLIINSGLSDWGLGFTWYVSSLTCMLAS